MAQAFNDVCAVDTPLIPWCGQTGTSACTGATSSTESINPRRMARVFFRLGVLSTCLLFAVGSSAAYAEAPTFGTSQSGGPGAGDSTNSTGSSLDALLDATQQSDPSDSIPFVRRKELQAAAQTLGTQAGLADRSAEILADLKRQALALDQKWRFTDLIFSAGVLPPVITTSEDATDVTATTMVVRGVVYHVEEPARFVSVPPTWRDWLLVGLSIDKPRIADFAGALPRNSDERAYWKELIVQAYAAGRAQADQVFALNIARLKKAYFGMRLFYQLVASGQLSAPTIASSTQSVVSKDPNTVVIGQTVFRITAPASFASTKQWKPLAP